MFIEKFVKAMVPSLARNEILEDIDSTVTELSESTLPPYAAAFENGIFSETYRPKSKWLINKQKMYKSSHASKIPTIHVYIQTILSSLPERLEFFRKHMSEGEKTIVSAGIDYQTANLIQFISASAFVSRYARKFLLMSYAAEMPEYFKNSSRDLPFSKMEQRILEDQFQGFMDTLLVFSMPMKEMAAKLSAIPEFEVAEDSQELANVTGAAELEPIMLGFVPYRFNPIYHIRMGIADWQHDRYLAAKDEKQALDLRLLALKAAKEGGGELPPALEKQIEVTEKRVMNLNHKISKMEKD